MRGLRVFAVLLAASAPARAVTLKAAPPARGAALAAWAGAVAPTLSAVQLAPWDLAAPSNQARLRPLVEAVSSLRAGLTPEAFQALPAPERERLLGEASRAAGEEARSRLAALKDALPASTGPQSSQFALRRAEALREAYAPYLGGADGAELDSLVADLRQVVSGAKAERLERRLRGVREALVEPARAPEAVETAPEVEVLPPGAPLPAVFEPRFTVGRARSDEGPLARVREKHGWAIRHAAASGLRDAFWAHADLAFDDLELEFLKDDLDLIGRHALGPWAEARLASYERQADALWETVSGLQQRHGIASRPGQVVAYGRDAPVLETHHADSEAYDSIRSKLAAVRERDKKRRLARRRPAVRAAARLGALDRVDARASGPLLALARYHARNLEAAEDNPDPAVLLVARAFSRDPAIPGPARLRELWGQASSAGAAGSLKRVERALFAAGAASSALGTALALLGSPLGALAALAAAFVLIPLAAAARSRRRSFEGLGERLKALLRR